ncbi:MAG: DUF6895 family protein [Jatrophihabitantaceae bacterium]
MTVRVSGEGAAPDASPGHARDLAPDLAFDLVRSALDVAELLIEHVVEPGLAVVDQADFTKEVAEVAMLLRLADRVMLEHSDRVRITALGGRIASIARSGGVRNLVAMRPSRASAHLLAHGCLQQIGCTDDGFDELARAALSATAAGACERAPYRLLDIAWIRHLLLDDAELDHPALALSPIAKGVDLVGTSIEDAYAFSHALPYATDFGRCALPEWADLRWLSELADALVLKALDEDDLDLLGELLMAPALLRTPWSDLQRFGLRVLSDTWRYFGFVPGPGLPEAASAESVAETRRRVLGTVYHTTLVGGLLVATLLSTGYWPSDAPTDGRPAGPTQALPAVVPNGATRVWERVWQRLEPVEQARLAVVPAAMALHRAVAGTDVVTMVHALNSGAVDELPGALVTQVAELVNRLAVLVGAR